MTRKPYPSDVTDDEWAFVAPYLVLMKEDAPQREHELRAVFNGLRWIVRTGAQWRMLPNDLPLPPVPCQICGKPGHKERYCPNAKGLAKRILDSAFHAGTWLFLEDPYSVSYGNTPLFLYN